MKNEYLAIIIFIVAFIIFVMAIGYSMHIVELQQSMMDCIHTNGSLPVEEAARICGGFVE